MELGVKNIEPNAEIKVKKISRLEKMKKQKALIIMSIPFVIYTLIFNYAPLIGWVMAFQRFKPGKSLFNQTWVGFEQFKILFSDPTFLGVVRNTLGMSLINLTLGFICSIVLLYC